jgi:hypothetical protein
MATDVMQDNRPAMTVEAFRSTPAFSALTPAQRVFALFYVEHGDGRAAICAAYPLTKKRPAAYTSQLLGKLLSAPNVRAALGAYFGWSDRTKFLADLDAQIHRAKTGSPVLFSLLALKSKILGLTDSVTVTVAQQAAETPETPRVTAADDLKIEVAPRINVPKSGIEGEMAAMSKRIFGH